MKGACLMMIPRPGWMIDLGQDFSAWLRTSFAFDGRERW